MRLSAIAFIAIVVVGLLLFFGVINIRDLSTAGRVARANAKAMERQALSPLYVPEKDIANAKICCQNLKLLESAKRAVAEQANRASGTVSWSEVLRHMGLKQPLQCPAGGSYSLNQIGQAVTCSIQANGTASHADDHNIRNF